MFLFQSNCLYYTITQCTIVHWHIFAAGRAIVIYCMHEALVTVFNLLQYIVHCLVSYIIIIPSKGGTCTCMQVYNYVLKMPLTVNYILHCIII